MYVIYMYIVDVASIILVGGIAAEALACGAANGEATDETDLRKLLGAQEYSGLYIYRHACIHRYKYTDIDR